MDKDPDEFCVCVSDCDFVSATAALEGVVATARDDNAAKDFAEWIILRNVIFGSDRADDDMLGALPMKVWRGMLDEVRAESTRPTGASPL